jgi:hypothetical protein
MKVNANESLSLSLPKSIKKEAVRTFRTASFLFDKTGCYFYGRIMKIASGGLMFID